ncbi:DUF2087 domain-containing protein [Patescibacteria group bacterium]|nr:DUF2087 domain-containing protein [Patescibacteria group bacterium]
MMKKSRELPPELFIEDPKEKDLKPGYVPERWLNIENAQVAVWQQALEENISERKSEETEDALREREELIQHHLDEYFLPPSFENGPYANSWHRNLNEILNRIIDLEAESENLPEKDERITFSGGKLEKRFAILDWLRKKIFASLPEGAEFTEKQIEDMFNNISQEQMSILRQELINSGLLIQAKTSQERWIQTIEDNK